MWSLTLFNFKQLTFITFRTFSTLNSAFYQLDNLFVFAFLGGGQHIFAVFVLDFGIGTLGQ